MEEKIYLKCDVCLKKDEYQNGPNSRIYHYTGTINGEWSNHFHVCENCREFYRLAETDIVINIGET